MRSPLFGLKAQLISYCCPTGLSLGIGFANA
jgi:hypothetical protein